MDSEQLSPTKTEIPEASSAAVIPMDPEKTSPSSEAPPEEYSKHDDPNYWDPEWGQHPPKEWKPHLEKFTLFPKLPIEIREAIFNLTLKPRAVALYHSHERGYWSDARIPVVLRVNRDSRTAVGFLYPLCFGSILHQPRTVVNFSMDTLYFEAWMWTEVPRFLMSLKDIELNQIQPIAVHQHIDNIRDWDEKGDNPYNNIDCFRKAALAMPALKEFRIVYKLDEMWHDHGFPDDSGPIELFEEFPSEVQQYLFKKEIHLDNENGQSEYQELPNSDHILDGFSVAKRGSIWGWAPT